MRIITLNKVELTVFHKRIGKFGKGWKKKLFFKAFPRGNKNKEREEKKAKD